MYGWNWQAPRVARARARAVPRVHALSLFASTILYCGGKDDLKHSGPDAEVLADLVRFDKGVEHGYRGGGGGVPLAMKCVYCAQCEP